MKKSEDIPPSLRRSGGFSREKTMVVDCPSCRTKFAVDPGLLEGVHNPRFHCSRCDHYFEVGLSSGGSSDSSSLGGSPPVDEAANPEVEFGDFGIDSEILDEPDTTPLEQLSLPLDYEGESESLPFPSDLFLDDLEHEPQAVHDRGAIPGVSVPWPSERGDDSLETDLSAFSDRGQNFSAIAAMRSSSDAATTINTARSGISAAASIPSAMRSLDRPMFPQASGVHRVMDFDERPLPGRENWPTRGAVPSRDSGPSREELPTRSVNSLPSAQSSRTPFRSAVSSLPLEASSYGVLARLVLIPILFLGVLSIFGVYPVRASAVVRAIEEREPLALVVPPRHLSVDDLSADIRPLENGTRVFEIRGRLSNQSEKSFKHVMLKASLLTEDGQEIRSVLFPAANQLQGTVIESLNEETLEALGKKSVSADTSIASGTASNFRLIIEEPPPSASHYTVRVFGAEKVPSAGS